MRERKTAEGRCVKTIVLTKPIRLDTDDAIRLEIADMMLVVKKMMPKALEGRENFVVKK